MSNGFRRRHPARFKKALSRKALVLPLALLFLSGCFAEAGGLSAYQADTSWGCKANASGKVVCPGGRQR